MIEYTKITKRTLPITLSLAKEHLRLGDYTGDDKLIADKLEMAFAIAEDFTGRLIRPKSVVFNVLLNADGETIRLPMNTQSVSAVSCLGKKIAAKDYVVMLGDYSQQIMFLKPEQVGGKITVTAIQGYTKTEIPATFKAAILLILGTIYDNESDQIVGRSVSELSLTAQKLLDPWRITPYGYV
nr:MAG TPA: Head Tail Connector Protein [Caudoviricetes sp.]